ncbi:hypothetical protein HDV06_003884 [Boothiomyces sp. JEL0866]|nr:hypothetical protein HDV06_003884 [Boothiomyces sp. JEL0866]
MQKEEARMWTRLGLSNTFFTLLIIALELISARASQIPALLPWLELFFACNNFFEANIVLQILDETKKQLVKTKSKTTTSSHYADTQSEIPLELKTYPSGTFTKNPKVF